MAAISQRQSAICREDSDGQRRLTSSDVYIDSVAAGLRPGEGASTVSPLSNITYCTYCRIDSVAAGLKPGERASTVSSLSRISVPTAVLTLSLPY